MWAWQHVDGQPRARESEKIVFAEVLTLPKLHAEMVPVHVPTAVVLRHAGEGLPSPFARSCMYCRLCLTEARRSLALGLALSR